MNVTLDKACSEPVPSLSDPHTFIIPQMTDAVLKKQYSRIRDEICTFEGSKDIHLAFKPKYERALINEQMTLIEELKSATMFANYDKLDQLADEAFSRLKRVQDTFPSASKNLERDFARDVDWIKANAQVHVVRRPPTPNIGMSQACKQGISGLASTRNVSDSMSSSLHRGKTESGIQPEASRAEALERVWNCSKPATFFHAMLPFRREILKVQEKNAWEDRERLEKKLTEEPKIDYYGGRCIKTDFSNPENIDLERFKKTCRPDLTSDAVEKCINQYLPIKPV